MWEGRRQRDRNEAIPVLNSFHRIFHARGKRVLVYICAAMLGHTTLGVASVSDSDRVAGVSRQPGAFV
jgi:uncharacterized membrane protein